MLCRLSNKCESIKFSRDISKSVTKEFDLKLPDSIPDNSSEFMANLVKYLDGVLVDFFKDKKATLHYCNMEYDATNRYCTLMVDYTEDYSHSPYCSMLSVPSAGLTEIPLSLNVSISI